MCSAASLAHGAFTVLTVALAERLIPPRPVDGVSVEPTRTRSAGGTVPGAMVTGEESDLTDLIRRGVAGDAAARALAVERVMPVLRKMARTAFRRQGPEHTLQPTALVNEAYLRVFGSATPTVEGRGHFICLFGAAMRSALVDHARGRDRDKRSPDGRRIDFDVVVEGYEMRSGDLVALDDCLEGLAKVDPRYVQLVDLRFFGGQSMPDIAALLGVPLRSLERDWAAAKAWLAKELGA